jgi:hypothetical protein
MRLLQMTVQVYRATPAGNSENGGRDYSAELNTAGQLNAVG